MNIETVIRYLDDETTYQSNWSEGRIKTHIGIAPERYILYAHKDILLGSEHGYINALSNVKRALFCQVDRLMKLLGFYTASSNVHQMDYLTKVSTIRSFGITIPEKLNEVNRVRNIMEHHYRCPPVERVKCLLYEVTKFIQATTFYTEQIPVEIEYSNHLKQDLYGFYKISVYINRGEKCLYITSRDEKTTVRGEKPQYVEALKRHLQMTKQFYSNTQNS